jgi:hypothetical protein
MNHRFSFRHVVKLTVGFVLVGAICLLLILNGWDRREPHRHSSDSTSAYTPKSSLVDPKASGNAKARENSEKQWLAMNEEFEGPAKARTEAMSHHLRLINQFVQKVGTNKNVDAFADKITGFEYAWDVFQDETSGRACVIKEFKNYVLDSRSVVDVIENMLADLDKRLVDIDGDLLIECGLDVNYQPTSFKKADLSRFHASIDAEVGGLLSSVKGVWGQSVTSAGIGVVVGAIAEGLIRGAGKKDARGNATTETQIASGIGGLAAGWAAEEAAGGTKISRSTLIRSADVIRLQILEKLKAVEAPGNICTSAVMCVLDYGCMHEQMMRRVRDMRDSEIEQGVLNQMYDSYSRKGR